MTNVKLQLNKKNYKMWQNINNIYICANNKYPKLCGIGLNVTTECAILTNMHHSMISILIFKLLKDVAHRCKRWCVQWILMAQSCFFVDYLVFIITRPHGHLYGCVYGTWVYIWCLDLSCSWPWHSFHDFLSACVLVPRLCPSTDLIWLGADYFWWALLFRFHSCLLVYRLTGLCS